MKAFEIQNLVKTFPEFQLGPLNLDLEPGTVLGYVGPNGSGKTTTLHCIVGLLQPDSGAVQIFGRENDLNHPEWKLNIGYVGDINPFYENWSAARNLKFLSQFYPDWSDDLVSDLSTRFELPLDRKARELSTGNRVKLALVAALAHRPRLLLLDEPTAGLDPVVRTELLDVLFEILETGERAIFYSTHILSDIARLADELIFLNDGQTFLRTPKEDLLEKWRKLSFRLSGNGARFESAIIHQQEGNEHQVITSDYEATLKQITELGAENVEENLMSIDEIAVEIIKESKNVGSP
jgi:ABC-2 type transport system ATP-binding protein